VGRAVGVAQPDGLDRDRMTALTVAGTVRDKTGNVTSWSATTDVAAASATTFGANYRSTAQPEEALYPGRVTWGRIYLQSSVPANIATDGRVKRALEDGCTRLVYCGGLCHVHYARRRKIEKFGLTEEQYAELFASQNGLCAICNGKERARAAKATYIRAMAIDHCHETDRVRGLLCSSCNRAIGLFKDDPDLMRKAASYVERHRYV